MMNRGFYHHEKKSQNQVLYCENCFHINENNWPLECFQITIRAENGIKDEIASYRIDNRLMPIEQDRTIIQDRFDNEWDDEETKLLVKIHGPVSGFKYEAIKTEL